MDIYVINLDRRPDRLQQLKDQLDRLGLKFTRIAAVDGLDLAEAEDSIVDRATDACWRSHRLAFAEIVRSPAPSALILEDDAILDKAVDWKVLLEEVRAYVSEYAIDVVQLGFEENPVYPTAVERMLLGLYSLVKRALKTVHMRAFKRAAPESVDTRWDCLRHTPEGLELVPNDFAGGTHCYVISRRAAAACMKLNIPTFLPADDFFWNLAMSSEDYQRFKAARSRRSLAVQRNRPGGVPVDSDIEPIIPPMRITNSRQEK